MILSEQLLANFLEKIDASGVFGKSRRRARLLEHLLRAEMQGEGDALKAYSIGLDVLGRSDDFDPTTDSIVRVEVGRLREALDRFYTTDHAKGQIKVTIPKGTYRPVIAPADPIPATSSARRDMWRYGLVAAIVAGLAFAIVWAANTSTSENTAPTSSITLTLKTSENEAETTDIFINNLRQALSKQRTFSLLNDSSDVEADYDLVVRTIGQPVPERISLELIDNNDASIQWAEAYKIDTDPNFDALITKATDDLFPQIVSSTKDTLDARPLESLNAWELYLLSTWVPGSALSNLDWEVQRRDIAQAAVELDPELGQAHSVLADKLIYLSSIDATYHSDDIVQAASKHARDALNMAPRDTNALFNLAIHHWHMGQHQKSRNILERIIAIDPFNGFAKYLIGNFQHTCDAPPDDLLANAYEFDQQLAPDNPIRWVTLTGLGMLHLNRGELDQAQRAEAQANVIFRTPDTVMRYATILHALGNTNEAVDLVNGERNEWPNLDPMHFATVTMPRRCHEYTDASKVLSHYKSFAEAFVKNNNP